MTIVTSVMNVTSVVNVMNVMDVMNVMNVELCCGECQVFSSNPAWLSHVGRNLLSHQMQCGLDNRLIFRCKQCLTKHNAA